VGQCDLGFSVMEMVMPVSLMDEICKTKCSTGNNRYSSILLLTTEFTENVRKLRKMFGNWSYMYRYFDLLLLLLRSSGI
jgi:hypothetical protein